MKYLVITAPLGFRDTVEATFEGFELSQIWWEPLGEKSDAFTVRCFIPDEFEAKLVDGLQKYLAASDAAVMQLIDVDTTIPREDWLKGEPPLSREQLFDIAIRGSRTDATFLLLVGLSTIVAAIGLLEENIAVVIGAMVIAPLLGPNLSGALSISLGEFSVASAAYRALLTGTLLALAVALLIGYVWPITLLGAELLARTEVGLASAVLAIASGAAAVLSLTTGVAGVLVGVMVAVAILPPIVVTGLMLGYGQWELATGAALLFCVNISAINLAAYLTLLYCAIAPRTIALAKSARRNTLVMSLIWFVSLIFFVGLTEYLKT